MEVLLLPTMELQFLSKFKSCTQLLKW